LLLVGRETPVSDVLSRLERNADTKDGLPLNLVTVWGRSLKMRTTGDYQLLDQPQHASLLERLEYFRAVRASIDSSAATRFAMSFQLERLSEWSARILEGSFSVEDGNIWAPRWLRDGSSEYTAQFRNYHGRPLERDELCLALNTPWTHVHQTSPAGATYEVLGWSAWAQQHQRQICSAMETTSSWLDYHLGLPDDAKDFRRESTQLFQGLELFPLVKFHCAGDAAAEDQFGKRVAAFYTAHPERMTFAKWDQAWQLAFPKPGTVQASPKPNQIVPVKTIVDHVWFNGVPYGTLYDLSHRSEQAPFYTATDVELEALKRLAPSNIYILSLHQFLVQRQKHCGGPDVTIAELATRAVTMLSRCRKLPKRCGSIQHGTARRLAASASLSPTDISTSGIIY
jgi:hypothetical protein